MAHFAPLPNAPIAAPEAVTSFMRTVAGSAYSRIARLPNGFGRLSDR
jgi:hypothetical protein